MTPSFHGFDPLLHEDLVTPLHHHDDERSSLVLHTEDGPRLATPSEASAHVARHRPRVSLGDVDHVADGPRVSRRALLGGTAAGFGALLAGSMKPRYAFAGGVAQRDLLIVIFLRGGMDGLSAVAPVNDPYLMKARPYLALKPGQGFALDGAYMASRHLKALEPLYRSGQLAVVVGAGHPSVSRSHFEDQALVEHAAPANVRSGWLARHLEAVSASSGTLRAITRGQSVSMSLTTNAFDTVAMGDLARFDLDIGQIYKAEGLVKDALATMYKDAGGPAAAHAASMFGALKELAQVRAQVPELPSSGYPAAHDQYDSAFTDGLRDIVRVAKGGVGLEVACLDYGDWDMHRGAGAADQDGSWFARKSVVLAEGLASLQRDLGPQWARTTVVTMSEFGRRVEENAALGFDHGHGNVMFVLGGGVKGGKVYGRIPSLAPSDLVDGDVPVTTDYRQVLSEIVRARLGDPHVDQVFPGFTPGANLGVV